MQNLYATKLAELIKCETISSTASNNDVKFKNFVNILKNLFPNLFNSATFLDFEGSFVLKIDGANKDLNPIMLMNHYDVVEATGKWSHPPFSGTIDNGILWGRGTLDTKGGLFCMLQAIEELIVNGFQPKCDVYFVSTCNEETSGKGATLISNYFQENNIKFSLVLDEGGMILNEPISGANGDFALVGVGEKAIISAKFIAKSNGGHASTPKKNSPLVRLSKFMVKVDGSNVFKPKLSNTIAQTFKRIALKMKPPISFILKRAKFFAPILNKLLPMMSPTANALIKTTVAFTMAQGSNGDNVIPESAYVVANIRVAHHNTSKFVINKLTKIANKFDLQTEILELGVESSISNFDSTQFRFLESIISKTFTDVIVAPYIMTGASDCRFMSPLSDFCFRFSPFKISNKQLNSIHGVDEHLLVSALPPAVQFYKSFILGV